MNHARILDVDKVGAAFGREYVSGVGDVNGDGYDDIIAGAYLYTDVLYRQGAAFVYYGSSDGVSSDASWSIQGDSISAMLGWGVSGAGDVNGDGYDDVVISAPGYDNENSSDYGIVNLYYGSKDGLTTASVTLNNISQHTQSEWFGSSVSNAGDINGDGYDDVVIYTGIKYGNGFESISVYLGSPAGIQVNPSIIIPLQSNQTTAEYLTGRVVSNAGDVNGDGYDDIIVGLPKYDGYLGAALIFTGSSSGLSNQPTTKSSSPSRFISPPPSTIPMIE